MKYNRQQPEISETVLHHELSKDRDFRLSIGRIATYDRLGIEIPWGFEEFERHLNKYYIIKDVYDDRKFGSMVLFEIIGIKDNAVKMQIQGFPTNILSQGLYLTTLLSFCYYVREAQAGVELVPVY